MSDFRPGNTKHEEGHSTEPAAVLGIAAELRCREAAVPNGEQNRKIPHRITINELHPESWTQCDYL